VAAAVLWWAAEALAEVVVVVRGSGQIRLYLFAVAALRRSVEAVMPEEDMH
jgi:hypothetical protein